MFPVGKMTDEMSGGVAPPKKTTKETYCFALNCKSGSKFVRKTAEMFAPSCSVACSVSVRWLDCIGDVNEQAVHRKAYVHELLDIGNLQAAHEVLSACDIEHRCAATGKRKVILG